MPKRDERGPVVFEVVNSVGEDDETSDVVEGEGGNIMLVGFQLKAVEDEEPGVGQWSVGVGHLLIGEYRGDADELTGVDLFERSGFGSSTIPSFSVVIIVRTLIQITALGAHPVLRLELDVVVVGMIEKVGERNERKRVPGIDLERAGGDEGVGMEEPGE
jgi:hypothetical protein